MMNTEDRKGFLEEGVKLIHKPNIIGLTQFTQVMSSVWFHTKIL
jgi:hypothetical protein